MRIGAALVLIAVGAILRFGISAVSTHNVAIHTIGDILMVVGVIGAVLWMVMWAPWTRSRRPAYRDEAPVYREGPVYREERAVYRDDAPLDEAPPTGRYPVERHYRDEYRR